MAKIWYLIFKPDLMVNLLTILLMHVSCGQHSLYKTVGTSSSLLPWPQPTVSARQ